MSSLNIAYYINNCDIVPTNDTACVIDDSIKFIENDVKTIKFDEPKALAQVMNITNQYWSIYKDSVDTKEYLDLIKNWDRFRQEMWLWMQPYDAIITPVSTTPAHPHKNTPSDNIVYTLAYSLLGWPCTVVRVGTSKENLPINVQIVAKPFHEEICLLIANRLEQMCGWQEPSLIKSIY